MEIHNVAVEAVQISDIRNLDPITVYWTNWEPGKGRVTIECYGCAWSSRFFGMGTENNIQSFFLTADTEYLVNKLGYTQWLKPSKTHEKYLGRIIDAVKAALRSERQVEKTDENRSS